MGGGAYASPPTPSYGRATMTAEGEMVSIQKLAAALGCTTTRNGGWISPRGFQCMQVHERVTDMSVELAVTLDSGKTLMFVEPYHTFPSEKLVAQLNLLRP